MVLLLYAASNFDRFACFSGHLSLGGEMQAALYWTLGVGMECGDCSETEIIVTALVELSVDTCILHCSLRSAWIFNHYT